MGMMNLNSATNFPCSTPHLQSAKRSSHTSSHMVLLCVSHVIVRGHAAIGWQLKASSGSSSTIASWHEARGTEQGSYRTKMMARRGPSAAFYCDNFSSTSCKAALRCDSFSNISCQRASRASSRVRVGTRGIGRRASGVSRAEQKLLVENGEQCMVSKEQCKVIARAAEAAAAAGGNGGQEMGFSSDNMESEGKGIAAGIAVVGRRTAEEHGSGGEVAAGDEAFDSSGDDGRRYNLMGSTKGGVAAEGQSDRERMEERGSRERREERGSRERREERGSRGRMERGSQRAARGGGVGGRWRGRGALAKRWTSGGSEFRKQEQGEGGKLWQSKQEWEYFEPAVGDLVWGVVVQVGAGGVNLDIGSQRLAWLPLRDAALAAAVDVRGRAAAEEERREADIEAFSMHDLHSLASAAAADAAAVADVSSSHPAEGSHCVAEEETEGRERRLPQAVAHADGSFILSRIGLVVDSCDLRDMECMSGDGRGLSSKLDSREGSEADGSGPLGSRLKEQSGAAATATVAAAAGPPSAAAAADPPSAAAAVDPSLAAAAEDPAFAAAAGSFPRRRVPLLSAGTVLPLQVMGTNQRGQALLSQGAAAQQVAWQRARQIIACKEPFFVRIRQACSGGVVARLEGLRAFMPTSLLLDKPGGGPPELASLVGQLVRVMIVEANSETGRLILSMKAAAAYEEEKIVRKGYVVDGIINKIVTYGAFVTIKRTTRRGLIHVSNISRMHTEYVDDVFKVGERVRALVEDIEGGNISLSTRDLESVDGLMFRDKMRVYDEAERMAELYREEMDGNDKTHENFREAPVLPTFANERFISDLRSVDE